MIILGLNAYHGDSSACIVIDGKVISAIEEERIRRIKHWAGFPKEAILSCLKDANINISDVDYIAVARNPSAHLYKKILMGLSRTSMHEFVKDRFLNVVKMTDIKNTIAKSLGISPSVIKAKVENIEHHKAHIASAFFVSPFSEAACISVDSFGDFLSTMRAIGRNNNINVIDWVEYPHSLGIFYTALTQYLGFPNYGDEYKVMGLSAYGKPVYIDKMRSIVKLKQNGLFELDTSYFVHSEKGVEMVWENGIPTIGKLFSDKLVEAFGSAHHQDIAASMQLMYEEAFFHILNDTYEKTKLNNLVLAGGCIQNSLANGKIFDKTPFKKVYIPPASYDAGLAIGAAMAVWCNKSKEERKFVLDSPYFGPSFTKDDTEKDISLLKGDLDKYGCMVEEISSEEKLCKIIAKHIYNEKVVGWFQGKTEFGPRALGNRSIVADPRKKEMKDILNARIKKREWFRPFAPSILEEKTSDWFECSEPVPFMEKVYKIKKDKQKLILAVCHVDGTGRLQTVSYKLNPRYYTLIKEFENLSGVPMILNTSFNENEPIVNKPEEALRCFLKTKMDVLVLGDFIIKKNVK